jgi:hypothetical protein
MYLKKQQQEVLKNINNPSVPAHCSAPSCMLWEVLIESLSKASLHVPRPSVFPCTKSTSDSPLLACAERLSECSTGQPTSLSWCSGENRLPDCLGPSAIHLGFPGSLLPDLMAWECMDWSSAPQRMPGRGL